MWFRRKKVVVAHKMRYGQFYVGDLRPGEIGIDAATGSLYWSTDGYNLYSYPGRIRGGHPFNPAKGFYNPRKQDYRVGVL